LPRFHHRRLSIPFPQILHWAVILPTTGLYLKQFFSIPFSLLLVISLALALVITIVIAIAIALALALALALRSPSPSQSTLPSP
jgi:hypothetical protein